MNFVYCQHYPDVILRLFNRSNTVSIVTRQHNLNFKVTRCRLQTVSKFIVHSGVVMWNNLPVDLRNVRSVKLFKRDLKQYIMSLHEREFV
jgi:hypothetical protein